jgi:hypothetical protein
LSQPTALSFAPWAGFISVPYQSVGAPSFAEAGFWFSASAKGGLIAANVTYWEKGTSPKIEALMLPTLCVHSDSNAPREIARRKGWGTHGLAGDGNFASESLELIPRKYLLFERDNANISCLFTVAYTVIGHADRKAQRSKKTRTLLVMNTTDLEIG